MFVKSSALHRSLSASQFSDSGKGVDVGALQEGEEIGLVIMRERVHSSWYDPEVYSPMESWAKRC